MDLLRSDFIHRIRRLPQKRRSFLLDVLEQGRQMIKFINHNLLYERYSPKIFRPLDVNSMRKRQKKEAKLALQMNSSGKNFFRILSWHIRREWLDFV